MDQQEMDKASQELGTRKRSMTKTLVWIIVGIVAGVLVLLVGAVLVFFLFFFNGSGSIPAGGGDTYPYIFLPRNTIASRSLPELMLNVMMDLNETGGDGADYNVIRRSDIGRLAL